jgi:diguanylate cyclase (GGDEF)-like protein
MTRQEAGPDRREREFAGQVAGGLWMAGATSVAALMLLPATDTAHLAEALFLAGAGVAWGLCCLLVVPWASTRSHLLFHVPAVLAIPYIVVVTALTGGADSPAWLTLVLLVGWCGYFLPPAYAAGYTAAAVAVAAAPLVYDAGATQSPLPGQLLIAVPMLISVGVVLIAGKRTLAGMRAQAEYDSLHDDLTGLPNRRALTERLAGKVGGSRAEDRLTLMIVDLDDFKDANTLYGMPGGDAALKAAADALEHGTREGDLVARLGGDEFAVVIEGAGSVEVQAIAQRILRSLSRSDAALGAELPGFRLRASLGWARYPDDAATVDELIAAADFSLRGAKAAGKGGYQSPLDWLPEPAAR